MKDPYKRLSSEWGSKARKAYSRAAKSTLKKIPKEELDLEFERVLEELRIRMANPPDKCERCDKPIDEDSRQWDGNSWFCDDCAEETQQ